MDRSCLLKRLILGASLLTLFTTCDLGTGTFGGDQGTVRLDVPVSGEALQATTTNSQLCCCRVVGTVENKSSVPVHVSLKYAAYRSGQPDPVGVAFVFLRAVRPGERRRFEASGFVIPCGSIDRFVRTGTNLRGVYFPE